MNKETSKRVSELWEKNVKKCWVSCDEYHPHSAIQGCIGSKADEPKEAADICFLIEVIRSMEQDISDFVKKVVSDT